MTSAARRLVLALLWAALCAACSPADPASEARALRQQGHDAEAIALLEAALAERPDDPELNQLYGIALIQTGQHSAAHWPLRRAMESPEWRIRAALPLAQSLLAISNQDAALTVLDPLLQDEPDHVEARLLRAQARLLTRRMYEEALADVDYVLELEPENMDALAPRAAALLGLERLDEVADTLERLEGKLRENDLAPNLASHYCLTRATFAQESGDLELAEERFEGCLEASPLRDEVITATIDFHESNGDGERAMEILREALERTPEATLYRTALAERLERLGREPEAEQLLRDGLTIEGAPEFVRWANLSAHFQRRQRFEEALEALAKATELISEPPPVMQFELAEVSLLAGDLDGAVAVAQEMSVPAMRELVLGRVHYERGEWQPALDRLSAGLALWPDNAVAHYFAGRTAEQLGDFDRAIDEYRYAVRSNAEATDARYRITRIRLAEGDLAAARTEATQASDRFSPDWEAELLILQEIAQRGAPLSALNGALVRLGRVPSVAPRALVTVAEAVARSEGAEAAARYIAEAEGLDLTLVAFADALDTLVGLLIESGQHAEAERRVVAARAAVPSAAAFLAVEGHRLERSGAEEADARDAYRRALAANPAHPIAHEGLARLDADRGDVDAAVDHYHRAAAARPGDPSLARRAPELLIAAGRTDQAIEALRGAIRAHPTDTPALLRLGGLLMERGAPGDLQHALDYGERARRFRGGEPADALVARARARLAAAS